nr:MAG TPA: hypothetical protein [Caudoviricetes sp.]
MPMDAVKIQSTIMKVICYVFKRHRARYFKT